MALTLTLWVSVEERDAAGATREVQEAMKIHAEFDDNTVDGLKGGLAKKLQRLQGQTTGNSSSILSQDALLRGRSGLS
jgi:hypothetical protein